MKKGIILLLSIAVLLSAMTLFDYVRSRSISIEVLDITPDEVVADPQKPVTVKLKVKKNGVPVDGHDITCLVMGAGNIKADRLRTDSEGVVEFIYYPYSYLKGINEESQVTLRFKDVSDSILIAVQKPQDVALDVKKPDASSDGLTIDDIFKE